MSTNIPREIRECAFGPLYAVVSCFALCGCASPNAPPSAWGGCTFERVWIDATFEGARANGCRLEARGAIDIRIAPENTPINPSPWYAFRVTADRARSVELTLHYAESRHRYAPKLSHDGVHWSQLEPHRIVVSEDGASATLRVEVGPQPLWIAAQELWTNERYELWTEQLAAAQPYLARTRLGASLQGRDIWMLDSDPGAQKPATIVILGRQHPPEVTGAYALAAFVEYLLADASPARDFRERYRLVIVPNLNPDGVAHGHWRHNLAGVDLNRDWGPFTQPETQLMRDLLGGIASQPAGKLALVLDFHSTWRDLMYTQRDDEITQPVDFTARWIAAIRRHLPEYQLERNARNTGIPSARTYVYDKYGVPSITYEVGDDTDREQIGSISSAAAAALMETLE